MMTLIAEISRDKDGIIHPDDFSVLLLTNAFAITQEDIETGKDTDICVSNERQAKSLIKAIKAMCAALGWKVKA